MKEMQISQEGARETEPRGVMAAGLCLRLTPSCR